MNHSYVKELEFLILNTLLPGYVRYQQARGNFNPLKDIHPELLIQIKSRAKLPALLREK